MDSLNDPELVRKAYADETRYAARMAKRLETVVTRVEKDIQPIVERLTAVSEEAVRMSQLATQQVERVDLLFGDLSRRAEQTMVVVQQAIITPARESAALFSALRSTFAAIRGLRGNGSGRPPRGVEEDDALFIG